MKTFTIDPAREPRINYHDTLEFIEYCDRSGYAIIGIEVGVFQGDALDTSILDNSHARGESYAEYSNKCNASAREFIKNHAHYIDSTFVFTLVEEPYYHEHIENWHKQV